MTCRPKFTTLARRRRGFTLIEVLLVLAILGVIAAIVVPNLLGSQDRANVKSAKIQIKTIETDVQKYSIEHSGKLPASLSVLTEPWELDGIEQEPITDSIPKDPWGNEYHYEVGTNGRGPHQKTKKPDIWSNGPDGQDDGGDNDDVNNWDHLEE